MRSRRFVFNNYPGEWEKRRGGKYAWNYLLLFTHLAEKDAEEFNGLENFVSRQVSRLDRRSSKHSSLPHACMHGMHFQRREGSVRSSRC